MRTVLCLAASLALVGTGAVAAPASSTPVEGGGRSVIRYLDSDGPACTNIDPVNSKENFDYPMILPDMIATMGDGPAGTDTKKCTVRLSLDYSRNGSGSATLPVELAARGLFDLPTSRHTGSYSVRALIDGRPVSPKSGSVQQFTKTGPYDKSWEVFYAPVSVREGNHIITFETTVSVTKRGNVDGEIAQVQLVETHVYPKHA